MPSFAYTALDARGQEINDVIEAGTEQEAIQALRQAGYFPTSVLEAGKAAKAAKGKAGKAPKAAKAGGVKKEININIPFLERKTIKPKVLMIFTRQLATLIDSGLPLLRGLTVLGKQEPDKVLRTTIGKLADTVQGGSTFSDALSQHPKIFNKLYVNMVKAGELGGVMELVLVRLADFQEKAQKLKNKVVSAMFYPVIVLVIAIAIMAFLLVYIVPKFEQIFADMLGGKPLPALTQFVITLSKFVQEQLFLIVGGVVVFVVAINMLSKLPKGRTFLDAFKLRLPLFGDLVKKSAISRFTRTLGTLVTSGVPILQALNITRDTAGNVVLADAIQNVHDSVKEGESIVAPLEKSGIFPPMVVSMIDVGEETGQLPEMLLKIADVYDDEVDNTVAGLTSLLEPIMIVFLAVVVGTIVIALFLPLISIISNLQGG
ncbi:MAG: type II secretion system F family protein [Chthoniobacterales bacterium]|nr:type II secretion system F family protein [Chthoniobacterales bacterium]